MDALADALLEEVEQFALDNNVTTACATDVLYLRGRSRWTEELEKQLIALHKAGTPPNIMEFGA
jgi:hypothetical protein